MASIYSQTSHNLGHIFCVMKKTAIYYMYKRDKCNRENELLKKSKQIIDTKWKTEVISS